MPRKYGLASRSKGSEREVIGLIPAAGQATRLAPLPCSKELFPIGFRADNKGNDLMPKVVCHYLLEKMRLATITKAYIVIREGKWDIPAYFGNGSALDMHLAYLMMGLPYGVPYTIDQAYHFVKDAVIAFGFPDMVFDAEDAFVKLLSRHAVDDVEVVLGVIAFGFPDMVFDAEDAFVKLLSRHAVDDVEVVLGIFPADRPQKVDMVDLDKAGQVKQIIIKPQRTDLRLTWGIAVWTPVFTHFMHEYLSASKETAAQQPELFVGDVLNAAIQEGLRVEGVLISDKPYLDIGTGDDLLKAVKGCLAQVE
jgi:glucose-1-phosphate thymidylyltransferase